ncbi:MAG: hypothetical protein KGR26_12990, partial [Cyanobacteria bacterium REEB65]|nr:hypothetical protein [Cyanobacteria bacterium REEB65]
DPILARLRPDLAIHSKKHPGKLWLQHGKTAWVDPNQPEVQDYNIRLATEVAAAGVDEIQFDYVRFPGEGDTSDCAFSFNPAVTPKHVVITGFLKRAREALRPYRCLLGIDVFGVAAWGKKIDEQIIGQRIHDMAQYVDVISPMVYPSHFYGTFDGYGYPGDHPYYFVSQGVARVREKVGPRVTIRPWLQAFTFRVHHFDPHYVERELQAARDAKACGWLLWNAGNKYDVAFTGVTRWARDERRIPTVAVHIKGESEHPKNVAALPPKPATANR